jgi:hypothetical protein
MCEHVRPNLLSIIKAENLPTSTWENSSTWTWDASGKMAWVADHQRLKAVGGIQSENRKPPPMPVDGAIGKQEPDDPARRRRTLVKWWPDMAGLQRAACGKSRRRAGRSRGVGGAGFSDGDRDCPVFSLFWQTELWGRRTRLFPKKFQNSPSHRILKLL